MKIHLNILIKKEIKEGPKFDTMTCLVLERIIFEVELAFGRLKEERSKLIRNGNVQIFTNALTERDLIKY
jgi:hypothetical protein